MNIVSKLALIKLTLSLKRYFIKNLVGMTFLRRTLAKTSLNSPQGSSFVAMLTSVLTNKNQQLNQLHNNQDSVYIDTSPKKITILILI